MINVCAVKEKSFVSIVLNYRNPKQDLCSFVQETGKLFNKHFESYEYVIVNTTDRDIKALLKDDVGRVTGCISVINFPWQHSLESAITAGVDMAIGDFVFEFDNIQIDYPTELIFELYQEMLKGYDILSASPANRESYFSRLFYFILSKVSYRHLSLTTESFRVVSRRAINRVMENRSRLMYRKAMYHYCGLDSLVHNYQSNNKKIKHYFLNGAEKLKLAGDIIVGYSNIGTRIAATLSLGFLLFAMAAGVYSLFSYFFRNEIQSGWTTTMLFMSASFSGIFFILALLSKYMTSLLAEIQEKNAYIFKSIERLSSNRS